MRGLVRSLTTRQAAPVARKQLLPARAYNAGFGSYGTGVGSRRRVQELQRAAGGTDETVTWCFACMKRIREAASMYPWDLHEFTGNVTQPGEIIEVPPPELQAAIAWPSPSMGLTHTFATQLKFSDLESSGNSYWLKNKRNGFGQPAEQIRLRPELVRLAKDRAGRKLGYVYFPLGLEGTGVPYDLDEVIHYRYPSLLDDHYGMGTIEAIIRAVNTELSQQEHVLGFFDDGARIGGLLVTNTDVSADEFEGMKEELNSVIDESGGYGIAMVEHAVDFKPITIAPPASGVIELRRMSKDEIYSGFNMSEFLTGGAAQSGTERMREAVHIFHTVTMPPKTQLMSEQTTLGLTALWGAQLRINATYRQDPLEEAQTNEVRPKAGWTLNEIRRAQGLPDSDHEDADKPMIASGVKVFGEKPPAPVIAPPPPAAGESQSDGETDEAEADDQVGDDGQGADKMLPAAPVVKQLPAGSPAAPMSLGALVARQDQALAYLAENARDLLSFGKSLQDALDEGYPDGFEQVGDLTEVDDDMLLQLRLHQIRFLRRAVIRLQSKFIGLFSAQQAAVLDRLASFDKSARVDGRWQRQDRSGKALDQLALWPDERENARLSAMYLPVVDELGAQAIGTPAQLAGARFVQWEGTNLHVQAARSILAEKVTRINDTTRKAIGETVEEGLRRGYPITRIANGYADEGYPGIAGVFAEASAARAETIARTESALIYNAAATAGYRTAGVTHVVVLDGTGDTKCAAANGSRWTIEQSEMDPIAHPNCIRSFAPDMSAVELEAPGADPDAASIYADPKSGADYFTDTLVPRQVRGTPDQAEALAQYTGEAYIDINGVMRVGGKYADWVPDSARASQDATVRNLSDLLDAQLPLDEPVQVFRGLDTDAMSDEERDEFLARLVVGATLEDPAFVSTTVREGQLGRFLGTGPQQVKMRIVVPRGVKALPAAEDEYEVLLQAGTRMRVVSRQDDQELMPAGRRSKRGVLLDVEILP